MLWTKLGMGLLGMAGKGLAGSGLLQTLSQGLGSGKGGGSGKGMGCGRGGSLHGSGMKGSRSGKDGKGCRQTDAPALDELLTGLLQRQTTVGETVRTFLPAASPHEAGAVELHHDLFEVFFRYLLPGGDLLQGDEPLVVIHRQIRHQPQAIAAFGGYFHVRKPPLFLYKKPSCRIYYGADILSIPQNSGKLNCK